MTNAANVNAQVFRSTFKRADALQGEELVLRLVREGDVRCANHLLRHHRIYQITSREAYIRDQIDQSLSYYSTLYIAIQARAVDPQDIRDELRQIAEVLTFTPLEEYYGHRYTLRTPLLFHYFLQQHLSAIEIGLSPLSERPSTLRSFFRFFDITSTFEFDPDFEWFLWIIDGGSRDGWNRGRLVSTLANPEEGATLFIDTRPNTARRILRGLLKFLEVCRALRELIQVTRSPLPSEITSLDNTNIGSMLPTPPSTVISAKTCNNSGICFDRNRVT